jgi:hypothetical protein
MSRNQRQAFRFRLPANKQAGKLSLGDETVKVRLVDHSANGFSLWSPKHAMATSGNLLRLETASAVYEVRVVHVAEEDGGYRLGLAVVNEITDSWKPKTSMFSWLPVGRTANQLVASVLPIFLGVLFAAGVVLIPVVGLELLKPAAQPPQHKTFVMSDAKSDHKATRSARTSTGSLTSRVNAELQQRTDQLGAAVFMMPDVAKKLDLTPQQIKNISRIVQKTTAAESVARGNQSKPAATRSRDLLRQSRDEARSVLNADQAKQWDALVGGE